jgi:hypothetical protein
VFEVFCVFVFHHIFIWKLQVHVIDFYEYEKPILEHQPGWQGPYISECPSTSELAFAVAGEPSVPIVFLH